MFYLILLLIFVEVNSHLVMGMTCGFRSCSGPRTCYCNITKCRDMILDTLNNCDIVFFQFSDESLCAIEDDYPMELVIFGITFPSYNFANGSIYNCNNFAECMKLGCNIYSKDYVSGIGITKKYHY